MCRHALILFVILTGARAETRTMTMREVVDLALRQNPDIALARLDERKAQEAVRIAKDPFVPRITVGSGLAYTNGFPMSIEGAAPSVVQARATQFIFNRQQSYAVAQAKEDARGATFVTAEKKDEVAYRAAAMFLDAERAGRAAELARKEVDSLDKVRQSVETRVQEGRELPLESKRAALNLARARQTVQSLEDDQTTAEVNLAILLGLGADDRIHAAAEERAAIELPASEDAAIAHAISSSKEIKRLESQMISRNLAIRGERAARLPRVDLVAQYGLFARFNNYEDFFRRFQRNNGQLGVSFQLPVLPGPAISALTEQAEADSARLRISINNTRSRIATDTRQIYREIRRAETASEVARLDLEFARENLSVLLALMQEGRASMRQVEEARVDETNKWIAFYDARYAVEKARLNLLRNTGELAAAIR